MYSSKADGLTIRGTTSTGEAADKAFKASLSMDPKIVEFIRGVGNRYGIVMQ